MIVGLIAAGAWISLLVIAVSLCRVAGRADEAMASYFPEHAHAQARVRQSAAAVKGDAGSRIALFPN